MEGHELTRAAAILLRQSAKGLARVGGWRLKIG